MSSENVDVTLEKLEESKKKLFQWFSNNFLKKTLAKYHLILSKDEFVIDNQVIKDSSDKKQLRVNLNNRLDFDTDVTKICKRRMIILPSFSYCLLV